MMYLPSAEACRWALGARYMTPLGGGNCGAAGAGGATVLDCSAFETGGRRIVGDQHFGAGTGADGGDENLLVEADGDSLGLGGKRDAAGGEGVAEEIDR